MMTLVMAVASSVVVRAQDVVRYNQVGYLPTQEKVVVIDDVSPKKMRLLLPDGKSVGKAKAKVVRTAISPFTGKKRHIVELTGVDAAGDYTLSVGGQTVPISVRPHAYQDLANASLHFYYRMRTGTPIEERYAGKYARGLGHPDTRVLIHPSAASPGRTAGSEISSPWGWYDAGDYNKYIVNSAFSIGIMLSVYEQIPTYFANLKLNIPENGNGTPDFLDEMYYNLHWMLTMQDPYDGGVYHKLTTPNFEGFVMPKDCHQQRYVVAKSVTAALDFAAVMAQASRLFKGNADYPEFSTLAAQAAVRAYEWAKKNPTVFYRQMLMNGKFEPKVSTGEYGDGNATDEWFWAATQLYLLFGDEAWLNDAKANAPKAFNAPVWGEVSGLGVFAWLTSSNDQMREMFTPMIGEYAERLSGQVKASNFQTPVGDVAKDFGWGCLAERFCAPGVSLLFATQATKKDYNADALRCLDYVLGRNALGYCYVTGFGQHSPMNPHHRPSAADGIAEPFPGMLVGGPNPGQQDKGSNLTYTSSAPDESYLDNTASYASNEIAINWNACLAALACWIDATL